MYGYGLGLGTSDNILTATPIYVATFDGISGRMSAGNPAATRVTQNFTVEFWMKADSANPATSGQIVGKNTTTSALRAITVLQVSGTNNKLTFRLSTDGTSNPKIYDYIADDLTVWNHFAMRQGSTANSFDIFRNGYKITDTVTKTADTSCTAVKDTTAEWAMCCASIETTPGNFWAGSIGSFTVFNDQRSDAEILADYNNGVKKDLSAEGNLVLHYLLNNSLLDSSTTGQTLVNTSATFTEISSLAPSTDISLSSQVLDNNIFVSTSIGYRTSPMAESRFVNNYSTSLRIGGYCESYALDAAYSKLACYEDGVYIGALTFGANGYKEAIISGFTIGRTVTIRNTGQPYNSGTVKGGYLTRVYVPSCAFLSSDTTKIRVLFTGDSIVNGKGSTIPNKDGFVPLIKGGWSGNVSVHGWGSQTLRHIAVDSTAINAYVSAISGYFDSSTENILVMQLGTNDYNVALWTDTAYKTAADALLDALRTAYPSLKIIWQGITQRQTELANANGDTPDDFRTAAENAIGVRSNMSYVNGKTWVTVAQVSSDNPHPNDAGHVAIKDQYLLILP